MPTISAFYGITIRMYWNDHAPPHFHVRHGAVRAVIDIRTLALVRGRLSGRALALVLEWSAMHRQELLENWDRCAKGRAPKGIRPLE